MNQTQDQQYANIVNDIIELLVKAGRKGPVTAALTPFVRRIIRSAESLTLLFGKGNPNNAQFDGAMILRGVYDAHIQALYILKMPESRAKLYQEYEWVERRKTSDALARSTSKFLIQLNAKGQSDPAADAEFDRVKSAYEKNDGGYRNHWYAGDLATLARDVGYEGEYLILSRILNGVVHSSYHAINNPHQLTGLAIMEVYWILACRVLGRILEYERLPMDAPVAELLKSAAENIFDGEILTGDLPD